VVEHHLVEEGLAGGWVGLTCVCSPFGRAPCDRFQQETTRCAFCAGGVGSQVGGALSFSAGSSHWCELVVFNSHVSTRITAPRASEAAAGCRVVTSRCWEQGGSYSPASGIQSPAASWRRQPAGRQHSPSAAAEASSASAPGSLQKANNRPPPAPSVREGAPAVACLAHHSIPLERTNAHTREGHTQ
jgi:hypothetical protein